MKRSLLEYVCCPACGGCLDVQGTDADDIQQGTLRCEQCSCSYSVRNGMPHLVPGGVLEPSKTREAEGWVSMREKSGAYEHPDLVSSFGLPYLNGGLWPDVARMFDLALQEMNLQVGTVVLDIGAGQGWASRHFAARGCRAIAIDVDDDELYGLGRARAIMERAGVYFECALADGENLPFFANKFDVIFMSAALHHFERFDTLLKQAHRVLKPGGLLIASGEPSIPIFTPEREAQSVLPEIKEGITERRPKVFEYWWFFRQAGFRSIQVDTPETYHASSSGVYNWIALVKHNLPPSVRLRYRPFIWIGLTILQVLRIIPCRWAGLLTLYVNGGNLLIRGIKSRT